MSCHCLKPEPWNRAHTERRCVRRVWNLVEETDRQSRVWAPRPQDLTTADMLNSEENVLLQTVLVCVWRVSLGWQMSDLSAPPPLWDHLLDWGHLEGGPSLSGVILQGSDPACWPTIDDHMITQNFLHVWVLLSVCLLYSPLFLLSPFSWIFGVTMKKTEINTTIIQIFSSNFLAAKSIVAS